MLQINFFEYAFWENLGILFVFINTESKCKIQFDVGNCEAFTEQHGLD